MVRLALVIAFCSCLLPCFQGSTLKSGPLSPRTSGPVEGAYGDLFEGDIVLTKTSRNAEPKRKWPGGRIPYALDPSVDEPVRKTIVKAIEEIEGRTCVKWVQRSTEPAYVLFKRPASGCNSQVGRTGQQQILNLGRGCEGLGTVLHEMMHAIGFHHEQNRPDRDQYVTVFWDNIQERYKSAFNIANQVQTYNQPYDYDSVTHYHSKSFSKNGKYTILPKDGNTLKIRFKDHMSAIDVKKINILYGCPDYKGTWVDKCEDKHDQCHYWSGIGECKSNPLYMLNNCRKSCKECKGSGSKVENCYDSNSNCAGWAGVGECKSNPGWMLKNCRKSCSQCSDATTTLTTPPPTTRPPPSTTPSSDCQDIWSLWRCHTYMRGGHCKTHMDIKTNCKKTCDLCNEGKECKDQNNNCNLWASIGECKGNPGYMLANCKKSCNVKDC